LPLFFVALECPLFWCSGQRVSFFRWRPSINVEFWADYSYRPGPVPLDVDLVLFFQSKGFDTFYYVWKAGRRAGVRQLYVLGGKSWFFGSGGAWLSGVECVVGCKLGDFSVFAVLLGGGLQDVESEAGRGLREATCAPSWSFSDLVV